MADLSAAPAKLRGQGKITTGRAVANALGDFTLTPRTRQERELLLIYHDYMMRL